MIQGKTRYISNKTTSAVAEYETDRLGSNEVEKYSGDINTYEYTVTVTMKKNAYLPETYVNTPWYRV